MVFKTIFQTMTEEQKEYLINHYGSKYIARIVYKANTISFYQIGKGNPIFTCRAFYKEGEYSECTKQHIKKLNIDESKIFIDMMQRSMHEHIKRNLFLHGFKSDL